MDLTVIIPAHNPHPGRLQATLAGLRAQTLPASRWETLLVNNASSVFPPSDDLSAVGPPNLRIVLEPRLGLTPARRCGFQAADGMVAVLVDDDNVLAPDYLEHVLKVFAAHPQAGLAGGKSIAQFEAEPPPWTHPFFPLLALRDLGEREKISAGLRPPGAAKGQYPDFAPIGAGMALRRAAWTAWLNAHDAGAAAPSDRRGGELSSAGDNDIVLCAMRAGWEVGYFPQLRLTHLIPAGRLDADYLARLNRGIQKSWMQVLTLHDVNPWPPLTSTGAALRKVKAWFLHRAWSTPAAHIHWQGACGHFEGRVQT
jgi:glycosyltransferase involved in cell wall biosynthesis